LQNPGVCKKPYKPGVVGKKPHETRSCMKVQPHKSVLQNPAALKKPYKTRSCGKEAKETRSCMKVYIYIATYKSV